MSGQKLRVKISQPPKWRIAGFPKVYYDILRTETWQWNDSNRVKLNINTPEEVIITASAMNLPKAASLPFNGVAISL